MTMPETAQILLSPSPDSWRSPLSRGMQGRDVGAWQVALNRSGYPLLVDEAFGRATEKATIQFQVARGLRGDGVVGPATRAAIGAQPVPRDTDDPDHEWPFLQAATWRWANRTAVDLIVVHTMENPEKPDSAEAVAAWFAGLRGQPPLASAHVCVDGDSLVRCVHPQHLAAAAPGANGNGFHIEHAGRAAQTAEQWADEYSSAMLRLSARHAAQIAARYAIPVVRLSATDVAEGKRGFCGHLEVSVAFKRSTHVDPGSFFPWPEYLRLVEEASL